MEHLALEVFDLVGSGSKFANLPENTTIRIRRTSQVFGSGAVFTQEFQLNIPANAHLFGTAGDIHGSRLHEQINKRKARIWAMGLPLYLGYLRLPDTVEVDGDGNVGITFESGQKTFEDMIEGAKANQVPFTEDILIGMALWQEREVDLRLNVRVTATIKEGAQYDIAGRVTSGKTIVFPDERSYETISVSSKDVGICTNYPRMVFPKGVFGVQGGTTPAGGVTVDQLNTDYPYDAGHPYCNIAVCYQKHGFPTVNGKTDYSADEQALRGYETAPANRVNSAPNFFVLYWLKCLMKHIGINVAENQMLDVEDLRRLFFVNTNCAYEVPTEFDRSGANASSRYGCYTTYGDNDYVAERFGGTVDIANSKLNVESFTWESYNNGAYGPTADWDSAVKMQADVVGQIAYTDADKNNNVAKNRRYHKAYATNECFPNVDVSEVIKALEDGFGVRFLFDESYQRVRIVLLRNIFRSDETQEVNCEIVGEDVKEENSIRGFRMTYGDKKDDTSFYYKGFADKLAKANELWTDDTDKHDYSHWNLDADYGKLITQISAFDKTCYVTKNNGNAYGIKIDKDAKAYEELRPSLFEYAGYMDAEDGDCTGEEATIKIVNVGFVPAIVNDVNFEQERDTGSTAPQYALFISEEMRSRRPDLGDKALPASYNDSDAVYDVKKIDENKKKLGLFTINSDMPVRKTITGERRGVNLAHDGHQYNLRFRYSLLAAGYINEGYRLYLQDNYEPNDDGVSPIETHDWGLTLGIMRGSGSDAYVNYFADQDDGEGNDTWDIVAGSSVTAHPDTCDSYGNLWDYNGSEGMTLHCYTSADAINAMQSMWKNSNINLVYSNGSTQRNVDTYINSAALQTVDGISLLFATTLNGGTTLYTGKIKDYKKRFAGMSAADMYKADKKENGGFGILIEVGSSTERMRTMLALQKLAFGNGSPVIIDGGENGIGVKEGRFSLKLRAEKPNPYFNASQPESASNRRYLEIRNDNLKGRGLADQFYKEFSYWIRNARIVKRTVRMELAQLLTIDDTVRVKVGDVTGFVNEMEYSIDMQTGLSNVTMDIMYI